MSLLDDIMSSLGFGLEDVQRPLPTEEPEPEMTVIERALRLARGEDIPPLKETVTVARPEGAAEEAAVGALAALSGRLDRISRGLLDPEVAAMSPTRKANIQIPPEEIDTTAGKIGQFAGAVAPDILGGISAPTVAAQPLFQAGQGMAEEAATGGDIVDIALGGIGGLIGGIFGKSMGAAMGRELVPELFRKGAAEFMESPAIAASAARLAAKFGPIEAAQEAITSSMKAQGKQAAPVFRILAREAGASQPDITAGLLRAKAAGGTPEAFAEELLDITRRGFAHTADPFTEAAGLSIKLEAVEPVLSPRLQRLKDLRDAGVTLGRAATPPTPQPRQMLLQAAEHPAFGEVVRETPELSPRLAKLAERRAAGLPFAETEEALEESIQNFSKFAGDPGKIAKIAGDIGLPGARVGKPFRTLKGDPQFMADTLVQDNLKKALSSTKVPAKVTNKIVKNFMDELSDGQRIALAESYRSNALSSARAVINKIQQVTTSANLKEHLTRSLAEEALKKGTTHSGLTGEDGFLMIGRLVDNLPKGSIPDLARVRSAVKAARGADRWESVFFTAMLSNPKTLARNAIGSAVELAMQTAGRAGRGLVTGNIGQATAQGQALFRGFGIGEGLSQAWERAGKAWALGVPEFLNSEELAAKGSVEGWRGVAKAFPRAMAATDDFFTTLSYHMDVYDQVYRRAWKSGKRGTALKNEVLNMVRNVPADIAESAMNTARRTVFRDLNPEAVEKSLRGLEEVRRLGFGFPVLGRAALTFIRTPFNLSKRGIEYTPVSFITALGHKLAGNAHASAHAMQRATVGTSLMAWMGYRAYNGDISGDGQHLSDKERATKLASGWKPNAIKIGKRWFSYRNMGPLTTLLNISANAAERAREDGDWYSAIENEDGNILYDTIRGVVDSSFLPTFVELMAGLTDPDRHGKRAWENLVRVAAANIGVPTMAYSIASAIDPTIRERATVSEMFSPVSGDPSTLLTGTRPRLGLFGEELKRGTVSDPVGRFAEIFLNPATARAMSQDPLIIEIARLQEAGFDDAAFNPPSLAARDLGLADNALTKDQLFVGRKAKGFLQRQFLERMLQNPRWANIPDETKARILRKQFEAAGRLANKRMRIQVKNSKDLKFRDIVKGYE